MAKTIKMQFERQIVVGLQIDDEMLIREKEGIEWVTISTTDERYKKTSSIISGQGVVDQVEKDCRELFRIQMSFQMLLM